MYSASITHYNAEQDDIQYLYNQFSPAIIIAFMLNANSTTSAAVNQWRIKCSNPTMGSIMKRLKYDSNSPDIRYMLDIILSSPASIYKAPDVSDSSNILSIITSFNSEEILSKIHTWGFSRSDLAKLPSMTHCLLAVSKININTGWPNSIVTTSNMIFNLCGGKVIQFDICEEVILRKNIYSDHVVYYLLPIYGKEGYIGFRYTYAESKDSTFINLVKISSDWIHFTDSGGHGFKRLRLPTFKKDIATHLIEPINNSQYRTRKVIGLNSDRSFSMNQFGHSILPSYHEGDNPDVIQIIPTDNNSNCLNFYTSSNAGYPLRFNIFAEMFYVKNNGMCSNIIPIVQTMICEGDM